MEKKKKTKEPKKTVGITIPCHSKCRHQCDTEQWRGSWFGPHRPAAEPPARPLSPVAYWVPRPPQLFLFILFMQTDQPNRITHTHLWVFSYIFKYMFIYVNEQKNRVCEWESERVPLQVMTWPWVAMEGNSECESTKCREKEKGF